MAANTVAKGKGSLRKALAKKKLAAPFTLKWPRLEQEHCSEILEEITHKFPPCLKIKPFSKKKQKMLKTERAKSYIKDMEKQKEVRKYFVFGINGVTRALEKDQLSLTLVCRSIQPETMTHHLLLLGATRQTPILCLHQLSPTLAPLLRLKRVSAIGFRKAEQSPFTALVEFIKEKVPPIEVPWLEVVPEHQDVQSVHTDSSTKSPKEKDLQLCTKKASSLLKKMATENDLLSQESAKKDNNLECPSKEWGTTLPSLDDNQSSDHCMVGKKQTQMTESSSLDTMTACVKNLQSIKNEESTDSVTENSSLITRNESLTYRKSEEESFIPSKRLKLDQENRSDENHEEKINKELVEDEKAPDKGTNSEDTPFKRGSSEEFPHAKKIKVENDTEGQSTHENEEKEKEVQFEEKGVEVPVDKDLDSFAKTMAKMSSKLLNKGKKRKQSYKPPVVKSVEPNKSKKKKKKKL
ncbi:predicted protein [Nematostella vectensis]|uniref:Uncharacterized protein n=1 Tax=Nematostella vectensis TaxID=45351 RepID=A7S8I1_NEMVE|nr:uncharacterized protein LOC5511662 [Nematostella vectensis]EDO39991.1 predicted protein [Nematostella vectensis]|eukprot:XP_001632054.1 predicted protein [Nematostella vectensis]